ncbi:hypothetical protein FQA39_LY15998 [Lamprigera yunnana]|nr:hypothetical protein FQA39_LY15998 [Lamprigera yunnana]
MRSTFRGLEVDMAKLERLDIRSGAVSLVVNVAISEIVTESNKLPIKYSLLKKDVDVVCRTVLDKAVDLKSAVERLYEKLVALEFDADHEAIYGMEKYYTVEQCKKLRDKYKIGRKVCRQFLKSKYCTRCLKDRLSKIGLQQLLDRINKYITNSDTSDEEEYKAVEQNGEVSEMTKEKSKKSKGERITKPVS